MELNVNNLSVDAKGRVSFSGLGSNIDFRNVVDSIIAAKRIPADLLQVEVDANKNKITALGDLRTMLTSVKDSLAKLYGAVSVGDANDIFETKEAFASTSRIDGGTASTAAALIGVTVTNAAPVGSHSIEVLQTAKKHKISSDQYASTTTAIGFSNGDTFTIGSKTISVSSGDTLLDVRDRINNANNGTDATGVSASIVSVTSSEHYLVLTKDDAGSDITLAETSGTPLQDLGIFTSGSAIKNVLQASRTAKFYADGLLDQTNTIYESDFQSAATETAATGGTLTFTRDSDSAALGSIAYTNADDLTAIAASITANITDVTASVVTDGAGVRLEITGTNGFSMSDTGSAITDFGIDNKRLTIERNTNTIDDVFTGVTVSLFQAEKGTTIDLDVERNLNTIKTEISNFVDSYNALRQFINNQRSLEVTDEDNTTLTGVLFGSQALNRADTALSAIVGAGVGGVSAQYSVLAQIGVDFIPLGSETDPLDKNTLEIDDEKLDAALLNNVNDVKRLFSFDFSASDPRVTLLGFQGTTAYKSSGFTVNIQPNTGDNMFRYSEEFDNAVWTPSRATISANATTAPNGQTTADGLIGDATNNTHPLTNTTGIPVTSGQSYNYSIYAKQGANDGVRIQLSGSNFAANTYADFDLTNGTLLAQGAGIDGYSVEDAGDGWYRVSINATATGTGNGFTATYSLSGGSSTYTGDGVTVDTYLFGAQLDDSATLGDYVPTTSSAATGTTASANIDGAADGSDDASASVSGSVVTSLTGESEGLRLFHQGFSLPTSVTVNYTVGAAAQMFFAIDDLLDETTGLVETEIEGLTDTNEVQEDRIAEMLERLEIQRQSLLERFIRMETALATANRILDSISRTTDAMFGTSN